MPPTAPCPRAAVGALALTAAACLWWRPGCPARRWWRPVGGAAGHSPRGTAAPVASVPHPPSQPTDGNN